MPVSATWRLKAEEMEDWIEWTTIDREEDALERGAGEEEEERSPLSVEELPELSPPSPPFPDEKET